MKSLQETYAPTSICFGCGPANERGLRIRSFPVEGAAVNLTETTMEFMPEKYQEAFPGMVNGGIIYAFRLSFELDCFLCIDETGGCARTSLYRNRRFYVKLRAPTPSSQKMILKARVSEMKEDRAKIEADLFTLQPDGTGKLTEKLCATCTGTFVAVKPGHPAYHRWS